MLIQLNFYIKFTVDDIGENNVLIYLILSTASVTEEKFLFFIISLFYCKHVQYSYTVHCRLTHTQKKHMYCMYKKHVCEYYKSKMS